MAQQAGMGVTHQDTLAVPPMPKHSGLNEDLVKILRENLLQPERPRGHRRSPSSISPRLSPRNSPRLLRRMMLNNNIHKQRRFTVAHTWRGGIQQESMWHQLLLLLLMLLPVLLLSLQVLTLESSWR
ncbi:hypothetical protein D4764_05G0006430 [Takifugu flavidus]|uniref:Uncharacterized protein n=1 Tax=Takifugu flavidus TaxID=433684 RepID=A0A5C6MZV2_9TELE|nr:hypothetical protein D4764_05G0006430 [Takifugu flavidus]